MTGVNQHFGFSGGQLKFLAGCSFVALILAALFLIRSFSVPTAEAMTLPTVVGSPIQEVSGVFQIDPNTAPADSLELLPGIGSTLADRIVAYRQHTPFQTELDITNVYGIGPRLYERLRPYLRVHRP